MQPAWTPTVGIPSQSPLRVLQTARGGQPSIVCGLARAQLSSGGDSGPSLAQLTEREELREGWMYEVDVFLT